MVCRWVSWVRTRTSKTDDGKTIGENKEEVNTDWSMTQARLDLRTYLQNRKKLATRKGLGRRPLYLEQPTQPTEPHQTHQLATVTADLPDLSNLSNLSNLSKKLKKRTRDDTQQQAEESDEEQEEEDEEQDPLYKQITLLTKQLKANAKRYGLFPVIVHFFMA